MTLLRQMTLVLLILVTAASTASATVYVNRDYYWFEPESEWRYTLVERHYGAGSSVTWNADSSFGLQGSGPVYVFEANVYVDAGATLNIGPGVTVRLPGGVGLYALGTLNAQGTAGSRITFTSTGAPSPGSWREIAFIGAGANASQMRYCDVSGGGDGAYMPSGGYWHYAYGNIMVSGCSPKFENCTSTGSANYAFYGQDACQADIASCSFSGSPYGIVLAGTSYHLAFGAQLPIRYCTISGNGIGTHSSAQAAGAFAANNTVSGNTRNVCEIYGSSVQNASTWHTMAGSPVWYLLGDVHCDVDKSLTIEPGGTVKLAGTSIYCRGVLTASGTAASPIRVTSYRNDAIGGDSNGDGTATSPAAGDWSTILLIGAGTNASAFNYCNISFGGSGRYVINPGFYQYERGLIGFHGSNAPVSNCQLSNSANDGLFLMNNSRPQLTQTAFTSCASYAVRCDDIDSNPALSACSAASCGANGIRIPNGTLTGSRTWYKSMPYVLEGGVWLPADAGLTIQPGVAVKFSGGGGFYASGNLQAVATSAERIYFTELRDDIYGDTNNDGGATAPVKGAWRDVALIGPAATPSRLEWCTVRYGGNSVYDSWSGTWYTHYGNVFTHDSAPTLRNCVIEQSGNYGIYSRWASNPVIENCIVRNNTYGIVIEDDAFYSTAGAPRVKNCTFTQNTRGASLSAESLSQFDANNTFSGNTSNALRVYASSIVNDTATWRRMLGTPTIVLDGIVRVPVGKTLTITPKNVVKLNTAVSIYAYGNLQAPGTSAEPIYFTSFSDDTVDGDTNANGAETAPAAGDWNSILFSGAGSSGSLLRQCRVRYGARGDFTDYPGYWIYHFGSLMFVQSDADIEDVNISSSKQRGIDMHDNSHPSMLRTSVTGSGSYAMWQSINSNASLSLCTASGNAWNGIYLQGGTIGDSRTWWRSIPYVMGEHVAIGAGAQLTLQPGTIVKLHGGIGLYCAGDIQAVAADADPKIVFTSVKDDAAGGDTNGDGGATTPAGGNWRELAISSADSSGTAFRNCIIRYGGDGAHSDRGGYWHYAYGNLLLNNTSASVEKCEISNSGNVGVYCRASCLASLVENTIHSNPSHGLYAEDSYNTVLDPLPIRGNEIRGTQAGAAINVNANTACSIASDNFVHDNANNGVEIREGALGVSGTWHRVSAGNCPFIITRRTWFSAPTALTIEPGVTVKFRPGAWLEVAGPMTAQGTDTNRIAFTSIKDDSFGGDTNGDSSATSPAGADWKEVTVYGSGGASQFAYCIFRYGGNASYADYGGFWHYSDGNVYLNGVAPSFDHCEFSFSGRDGVANAGADAAYQSCTFANNARMGLYTFGDSDVSLNSCILANNPSAATQVNGQEGGSIVANYCDLVGVNYLYKQVLNQNNQWVWTWTDTFPPGTGSFALNPLFSGAGVGNFNLSPPSPCINTGDPGKTDPDGSRMDVGAYPFTGAVATPTIGATRNLPDGANIQLSGKTVTAGTNEVAGRLYIEDPDRSSGIAVLTSTPVSSGAVVSVSGSLGRVEGERVLINTIVQVVSPSGAQLPRPMYVNGRDIGGRSLNVICPGVPGAAGMYNLGLLIRAAGRVTAVGTGCFWVEDGGNRAAEGGTTGIKVLSNAAVTVGKMVKVTGVSSAYNDGGTIRSVIRTRTTADVTAVN